MATSPSPSSAEVTARFRAQREKNSRPEIELRRSLHRRGLRYRLHVRPLDGLRRTVDVAFSRERVAVDVRGCFWHACPEHASAPRANAAWWASKLARNVERDSETERALQKAGWLVVVVWEHESAEAAAERVARAVEARR